MTLVVFRCDGDDRVGAGHVARCIPLARAFRARGAEIAFAGRFRGTSASLLDAAGLWSTEAAPGGAGIPDEAAVAIVDSYEVEAEAIERCARSLPLAIVSDWGAVPEGAAVLSYHVDATEAGLVAPDKASALLLGPDYCPVDPRLVAARHPRGTSHGLLTLGGGTSGDGVRSRAEEILRRAGSSELIDPSRARGFGGGLWDAIAWADLAVAGAGFTAYELACAGVPAVILAIADNQARVARALDEWGLAVGIDARGGLAGEVVRSAATRLVRERERLARAGPALIDGYGAFRACDDLLRIFAGGRPKAVVRFRTATEGDSERLRAWRNDPEVVAASRSPDPIGLEEHERWLEAVLEDPDRLLFVVEEDGRPVGSVRFDASGDEAEINIAVAASHRGSGLGARIIRESSELLLGAYPSLRRVIAEVQTNNRRSALAFERAGYRQVPPRSSGYGLLELPQPGARAGTPAIGR
jgi:spore coat polysaccharide biosynthesis predicted glycosyltransferase SpsG/ribosomal protein S18 acetylase RimI-like enzyme